VRILTGRTHQVRVHLAHLDCPVLGDDTYAGKDLAKKNVAFRKLGWVSLGSSL
jgi:23S rRNA-/tRNA-specific pseudouridylate synthase